MFISSELLRHAQLDLHTLPNSYIRATFFVAPLIRAFFEASYKSIESDNLAEEITTLSAGLKMMFEHSRLAIDEWGHFERTSYGHRTPRIVQACESGKLVPLQLPVFPKMRLGRLDSSRFSLIVRQGS